MFTQQGESCFPTTEWCIALWCLRYLTLILDDQIFLYMLWLLLPGSWGHLKTNGHFITSWKMYSHSLLILNTDDVVCLHVNHKDWVFWRPRKPDSCIICLDSFWLLYIFSEYGVSLKLRVPLSQPAAWMERKEVKTNKTREYSSQRRHNFLESMLFSLKSLSDSWSILSLIYIQVPLYASMWMGHKEGRTIPWWMDEIMLKVEGCHQNYYTGRKIK